MVNPLLLYIGSVTIFLWGIGHLIPTQSIVKGFGQLSVENSRIITIEWLAEGFTLCFIGLLVFLVTLLGGYQDKASRIVYWMSLIMLLTLAALTGWAGTKTKIVPIKLCPVVKTSVAILFLLGILL